MQIEVLTESKTEAEFVLRGERHTFPGMLRDALLQDSKVEMAAYKLMHPMDADSRLIVKTNGKTPKKALQDAVKSIAAQLDEFSVSMKKALK